MNNFTIKQELSENSEPEDFSHYGPDYLNNWQYHTSKHNHTNQKLLDIFYQLNNKQKYSLLDIGCGTGKFVADCIVSGHIAIGIDMCSYYKKNPNHLWSDFPNNAFIIDACKPYEVYKDDQPFKFYFITSWEHLEHINCNEVENWIQNLKTNSHEKTKFVFSASIRPDNGHLCIQSHKWWTEKFSKIGLKHDEDLKLVVANNYVRNYSDSIYFFLKY